MEKSPARAPNEVGPVAHVAWWLGALASMEAFGFLLSAWVMSDADDPSWSMALPMAGAMLVALIFVFALEQRRGTSVANYEQLPYSWGAFLGITGGSVAASAAILGVDLALTETFYAQVSQVIPVLLLAFAVEQRFFTGLTHPDAREDAQWAFAFVMVTAACAEVLSLASLASTAHMVQYPATIATAMAVPASLALLSVSAFVNAFRPTSSERVAPGPGANPNPG
jgi:hypothetical protein